MLLVIKFNTINSDNYFIFPNWDFLESILDFLLTKAIHGNIVVCQIIDNYFIINNISSHISN